MPPTDQTCARLEQLMERLDYRALGEIYCEEGGDAFWADRRGPVVELGLAWAASLAHRLPQGGRSLYVGAGVAELPVLLTEVCDLGRSCRVTNLRSEECAVLNAALADVGLADALAFEAVSGVDLDGEVDHVSAVSVLSDPETYPVLSAVTYGTANPITLDTAAFEAERAEVCRVAETLLGRLAKGGALTTTVEEIGWFVDVAGPERRIEVDDEPLDTAIVGDPICFAVVGGTAVGGTAG